MTRSDLGPGDRVGPYELVEEAGRGGQATVWRALLAGPGSYRKQVALKVLHPGSGGDLRREHRLGGLIGHPHVVEVFDVGAAGDRAFLALEWVDGPSLTALVRDGVLSPRAVAELGAALADALAHAHERGVVHGDVAPGNVLITRDGSPKLADLGLALFAEDVGGRPRAGTPGYTPPERAAATAIDGRSDVFGLGAVLFLAATGHELLRPTLSPTEADLDAAERRVGEALAATPDLAGWLRRMVAWRPGDRPTASEVRRGLQALLLPGRPLAARASPRPDQPVDAARLGNLPRPEDPFFGREAERAWLHEQLGPGAGGVITLQGTGGIGKTRLALEAAAVAGAPGGSWLVDLAACRTGVEVATAAATALGIRVGEGDDDLLRALVDRPPLVLVLDNADQVVEAVGTALSRWLSAAPAHRYVVTSREPLGIPAERVLHLGPTDPAAQLDLLRARARAAGWGGADDHRLPELLERLGGIPLAIELAAIQVADCGVARALAGLEGDAVGTSGLHPAMARALDASWGLLAAEEQEALCQWSVFEGGFSAEAADAVLRLPPDAPWSLDLLDTLLRKGLLTERGQDHEGAPRFGMYVPVQRYVASRAPTGRAEAEVRHGWYFADLSKKQDTGLVGRVERANCSVALGRAVARGDATVATYTGHLLWAGFDLTGPLSAGLQAIDEALGCAGLDETGRSNLLYSRGSALMRLGRMDEARAALEASLRGCQGLGLVERLAACHNMLGSLHHLQQRIEPATEHLFAAERLYGELGDRRSQSVVLANIGTLRWGQGLVDEAGKAYEASLEMLRRTGDRRREATIMGNLALVLEASGRLDAARELLEQALAIHRELGNRQSEGIALGNLGYVLGRLGDLAAARDAVRRALAIHEAVGNRRSAAISWRNLGNLEFEAGAVDQARACLERALDGSRAVGNRAEVGQTLCALARVDLHAGDGAAARARLSEAEALADELGLDALRGLTQELRRALGDAGAPDAAYGSRVTTNSASSS